MFKYQAHVKMRAKMYSMQKRAIFYISDGTGITAETLGHSLMTQFDTVVFEPTTIPFVDNISKAHDVVTIINKAYSINQCKPIIFATLINKSIRKIIAQSHGILFEFFNIFLEPLAKELQCSFSYAMGKSHSLTNHKSYAERIKAIDFTLACDDGLQTHKYPAADVILLGASRTGKTPTCLYLALQFGIKAANYPLVEEDMSLNQLPTIFESHQDKLCGLTIHPQRLRTLRNERLADSEYASLDKCTNEIHHIEAIYKSFDIPYLDTTSLSIEEIATKILEMKGIQRHLI